MRYLSAFCAIAVLFVFLTGCSAKRLPDYKPLSANQYTHKSTQDGLTVAIHPLTEKAEMKEYFGTDLLKKDILAVLVVLENKNSESSFIIQKQEIKLLSEEAQSLDDAKQKGAVGSSDSAEAVQVIGAALGGSLALIFIGAAMASNAAEIKRNFAMKELQQATLSPGDARSGFVYFQLPKPENSPNRWKFQIQTLDPKNKTNQTFNYVFDWKRR